MTLPYETRDPGQLLRSLPEEQAPPYDWAEYRRRAGERRAPGAGQPSWAALRPAMLAAAAVLAVAGLAWWQRANGPPALTDGRSTRTDSAAIAVPPEPAGAGRWLVRGRPDPALVRVDTHAPVAVLEDRIAWVDDLLSVESVEGGPPARIAALQRERAQLLDSLVQVRYAESLSAAVAR